MQEPRPQPRRFGKLAVLEQPVYSDPSTKRPTEGSAASLDDYARRLRETTVQRTEPDPVAAAEHELAGYADILAKFGFRPVDHDLVDKTGARVLKGARLGSVVQNERGDDFAAIFADEASGGFQKFLLQKKGVTSWESLAFERGGVDPVFVRNDLVWIDVVDERVVVVVQNRKVYRSERRRAPTQRGVVALLASKGRWMIDLGDDVVIDGKSVKKPSDTEAFGLTLIGDEPLWFFQTRKGAESFGLGHATEDLSALAYDDILHDACCEPAGYNPRMTSWGVRFHARRGSTWYYVEVSLAR